MGSQLDVPVDDDALYLAVDEVVEDVRPINQGDVYRGITLPGFPANDHEVVVLVTHACSLRAGPRLKPRLSAAPVRRGAHLAREDWPSSYTRSMPLPGLLDGKSYMAALTEPSVVTPAELANADRVASLSEDGIQLLQQRLVYAMTRTVVDLDTLYEFSAPVFAEIELLEEWNEALCAENEDDRPARLERIAAEFEEYIRTSGVQADLAHERTRSDARRRARDELRRRIEEPGQGEERQTA